MDASTGTVSNRGLWVRVVEPTLVAAGLAMLVVFWIVLFLSDSAISPIAFIDPPVGATVALASVHVGTAVAGWIAATVRAVANRGIRRVLLALVVVPVTAIATLLVLMTDATVWRGELSAWLGPMLMALSGPVALGALLSLSLVESLRARRDQGPIRAVGESPARRRRQWVAGALAGVILVALLAFRFLGGSSAGWEWVDNGRSLTFGNDVFAVAVAAGGPGFVAVGEVVGPSRHMIAWTSIDGRAWDLVRGRDAFGTLEERVVIHDMVGTPDQVIAVGAVTTGTGDHARSLPAIWVSADGHSWQRSTIGDTFGVAQSVAVDGSTHVVVGNNGDGAAIWVSNDGNDWVSIADPAFKPDLAQNADGLDPFMSLVAVTSGGPGFVAVGETARYEQSGLLNNADIRAVVFTSPDGTTWTRVPHDEAVFGGAERHRMTAVSQGGPGLVAVGYRPPRGPVAWASEDGVHWRRHPIDDRNVRDVRLEDLVRVAHPTRGTSMFVAVGQDWGPLTASRRDIVPVLTSPDGMHWTRDTSRVFTTGRGNQVVLNSVAASERGVVALGTAMGASWDSVDATVWFRPLAGIAEEP